jgi:hypothetical protein
MYAYNIFFPGILLSAVVGIIISTFSSGATYSLPKISQE